MSKVLELKAAEQNKCIAAVKAKDYTAIVLATVGYGKGRVMMELVKLLIKEKKIKSILYVCDNTRLRDNDFSGEVAKWGTPEIHEMITYECYQTTYKWKDRNFDLILGDEFDFAITKEYIKTFFNNNFKYKILMSGTLSAAKKKIALTIAPIAYTITTSQAEEIGILNKSNYFIYNYKLTQEESKAYAKWTRAYAKGLAAEASTDTLNFFLNQRKEVLYNSDASVLATRKVMQWLWNRNKKTRLVIFSERTKQADRLCKWSYHGGNVKDDNLTKFQNEEISGIAVVSKIKRGINLKNANTAIFEALSGSSETEFMQENGRLKRLDVDDVATIVFMCPWYQSMPSAGSEWKPTIVDKWIRKATGQLKGITFTDLKL